MIQIIYKNIGDIIPYENNPRNNEKAVEYVANSIKVFGMKQPIVIDKENVIVCGHTRFEACKLLMYDQVPCIVADDLTDEQIKQYRLADNKVSEKAEWDEFALALELMNVEIDMSLFGFDKQTEEEIEKQKERTKRVEAMQLKAFEHYDYVVFAFDNEMDWLNIVNEFDLHKVDAGYGTTKKVGLGRVVDGKRLLEKIQH